MFPFTLPWDDGSKSVISMAGLSAKPAGTDGFVQVKDGHFFAGKERLRIFGVNVCFGANFPTHEAAEKVAARMAKFGINCVRFHHMDMMNTPGGIFAKDGKTLDPERLDRLDYFVAKLKEHGIYTDLNLHVSRTYPDMPKDAKKANPSYDKGVDNFAAATIELQKQYARDLLTHKNAYTGNRYADEPAVALVEINNENSLGFQWWAGEMDDLPPSYATELQKLWTSWVKEKRGGKTGWEQGARSAGEELLTTGGKWNFEKHGTAVTKVDESGALIRIQVEKSSDQQWHVQFNRTGLKVAQGGSYEARFRAKGPKDMNVTVAVQQTKAPWKVLGSTTVRVGPDWRDLTALIRVSEADESARLSIGGMGQTSGEFAYENISLREAAVDGSSTPGADGSLPYLRKKDFARSTPAKQRDWQQFLWDTETKYWNGMRDFLKKEIGTKSLILGTQGFWSPAHVQAGMDVHDSHAYWHHPDFHGKGWNAEVWSVKNESMAGAPNGGELGRLAAQRVEGKPFVCTEYNHPAPNIFSAETFPLALAFAAAQDWDGVFAFSYSHRGDEWDQPYFNNFFDLDRHTAKMATLPAAVASFRRGDVLALSTLSKVSLSEADVVQGGIRSGPGFMISSEIYKAVDIFSSRFAASPKLGETGMQTSRLGLDRKPQLQWNTTDRVASLDSDRSKFLIGKLPNGTTVDVGNVKVAVGETRQAWGCYQLSVIEGKDFATANRLLITATGDTENTGMGWKSEDKTSVGKNWGKAPVLVEGPAAKITLPGTGKLKAWALDETGQRRAEVPVNGNEIAIGPEHKTLWYEVERQ